MKYKKGDLVIANGSTGGVKLHHKIGVIILELHLSSDNVSWAGIEFDSILSVGHDCDGRGKYGYCYYVQYENIRNMSKYKLKKLLKD